MGITDGDRLKFLPDNMENEEDIIPEGMERITVPLRGMEDGVIYFPENLETDDAKRAIRMAEFILKGEIRDRPGFL